MSAVMNPQMKQPSVTCSWESRSSLCANRLSYSTRLCCSSTVSASCCSLSRFISWVFTVWICTRLKTLSSSQFSACVHTQTWIWRSTDEDGCKQKMSFGAFTVDLGFYSMEGAHFKGQSRKSQHGWRSDVGPFPQKLVEKQTDGWDGLTTSERPSAVSFKAFKAVIKAVKEHFSQAKVLHESSG